MPKRFGYIHIYTGNGKGKTTAAMGLTLRAAGAGLKVYFIQFLKGGNYSEHKMLKKIPGVTLKQFGRDCLVKKKPSARDIQEAQHGWTALIKVLTAGRHDIVVADEICVAQSLGLLREADVLEAIQARPAHVELVLTGRQATAAVQRCADLVTVMQEKKHYYKQGVIARRGIEF